jgi:hypothetical protein
MRVEKSKSKCPGFQEILVGRISNFLMNPSGFSRFLKTWVFCKACKF